jgi:hypothetical protein
MSGPKWVLFGTTVLLLAGTSLAEAQTSCQYSPKPYPNGCSVPGAPDWMRNGLDKIFFGACYFHDNCWQECNGPNPPYNGVGHKLYCDAVFGTIMEGACAAYAAAIAFPLDDIPDAETFLRVCSIIAAGYVAAVNFPLAYDYYWDSQCCNGCNPDACANIGRSFPGTCGQGYGPSFCYLSNPGPVCGNGICEPGESCASCAECCSGGGGGGGGDDGGGGGGGGGCDPDGDGWVTPEECVYECGGEVDGDYCIIYV